MTTTPTPPKSYFLAPELAGYLAAASTAPDPVAQALIDETRVVTGDRAEMQIVAEQGTLLTMLARMIGVRRAVEAGTFTGLSALCIARGLAPGGRLITCDVSEEWLPVAEGAWRAAGVRDRIDFRLATAHDTFAGLAADDAPLDLVFLDADKPNYVDHYETLVPLLRPGGLLVADNVLWFGQVVDPAREGWAEALHRFNQHVGRDSRTTQVMLPLSDGVTIVRRND